MENFPPIEYYAKKVEITFFLIACQYRNLLKMLDFKWISQKNPSLSRNGVSITAYALRYG
jgi:hypothetical protein